MCIQNRYLKVMTVWKKVNVHIVFTDMQSCKLSMRRMNDVSSKHYEDEGWIHNNVKSSSFMTEFINYLGQFTKEIPKRKRVKIEKINLIFRFDNFMTSLVSLIHCISHALFPPCNQFQRRGWNVTIHHSLLVYVETE